MLNDLNVKFTVDNLSKVLQIMFTLYIEPMEIDKSIKLIEKLGYTEIFDGQNITNIIKTLEKLMITINEVQDMDSFFSIAEKLKYDDVLDMIYQASIKLYEKIKIEMIHDDFQIYIAGGLNISAMRKMIELKSLNMGSMKTMTMWNLYYVDK